MARIRPSETHVVIAVVQVAWEAAFIGARVAVEMQAGGGKRSFVNLYIGFGNAVIEESLIPLDLKIRDDANLARTRLQFAG